MLFSSKPGYWIAVEAVFVTSLRCGRKFCLKLLAQFRHYSSRYGDLVCPFAFLCLGLNLSQAIGGGPV
jgi:hypothetical protein